MRIQVLGKVGAPLNYDELVVYNNHAIWPSYYRAKVAIRTLE